MLDSCNEIINKRIRTFRYFLKLRKFSFNKFRGLQTVSVDAPRLDGGAPVIRAPADG